MKLIKSKKADINYLAKIVNIQEFSPHPNANALKIAHVGGYSIIVGIDEQPGLYIYFPALCQINPNLLSFANLYRHKEKNSNPESKPGFFEDNGRVKAIKLRSVVSEGFLLPAIILCDFILASVNKELDELPINAEFDCVEHNNKEFWICKKYVIKTRNRGSNYSNNTKHVKGYDKIDETQFKFHYDTVQVKKEPWCINQNDLISITEKIHGTSLISAYILCKKPLTIWKRLGNILSGHKWDREYKYYDYVYASRTVIKNKYFNKSVSDGYYGVDVWAEADKIIKPHLIKGMTIYSEIVGYLPNGSYIQKNYDYGCVCPDTSVTETGKLEYIEGKHFKVRPYRITLTNVDGVVHEFSAREVQQWCINNGLTPVTELYYGFAGELYPELYQNCNGEPMYPNNWNEQFWETLANDKDFFMECNSPSCNNKVPHEGLVIKKEDMIPRAWKLKCFSFLQGEAKELDAGESNIEDDN